MLGDWSDIIQVVSLLILGYVARTVRAIRMIARMEVRAHESRCAGYSPIDGEVVTFLPRSDRTSRQSPPPPGS